ncbi:MAG: UDP-N-acetylglucosamine--N-acetylmuramyl-(pentapeptide) pyrophosphoryl-undecaprenol N-acetylglucosamine transferase [Planctomycetota bacterium]|jgi:UDP-N-acetylglucosamine--N-acetylmuramyl-(pentapeptide) pyrophosphoryl-undecaprenol N-acetylglucosamine transferase
MSGTVGHYFFAGGGTGGHIYPALAVADRIHEAQPEASILYFPSSREVDARILSKTEYEFLPLPAVGLGMHPRKLVHFYAQFVKSYHFVKHIMAPFKKDAVVIGTGGFVTAPVVMAAWSLKIPVYLINVDIVPGKANRFLGRFAKKVFVQFADTASYFKPGKVQVTGCPLRAGFAQPDGSKAVADLSLDADKKVLLVTGASSGSMNINHAMAEIVPELVDFADDWQIVHLTGKLHIDDVKNAVADAEMTYHAVDYCDDMPNLLAAADVVVGRSGAVSVAEYAAAGKPAVCLPYPYHKDRHQYKNAQQLVDAGSAVIVEDNVDSPKLTAAALLGTLTELMDNDAKRDSMAAAARQYGHPDAAGTIMDSIL